MTDQDIDIVSRTLYGEARGEYTKIGIAGLIAVANVIKNRFEKGKYGTTYTTVCLKPKQFSCWNVGDPNRILIQEITPKDDPIFSVAETVAEHVISGAWPDLTRGSDHYHAISCTPYWAKEKNLKLRLGNHLFYKLS